MTSTTESPDGACCSGPALREPQSHNIFECLSQRFSPRRAAYIYSVLTPGELAVVTDPADALIIARIKRMPDGEIDRFERLEPAAPEDRRLFAAIQCRWLRDEQYLLSTRLGRSPTHGELFADFMRNHNGLRFRAYFSMKFPQRMRPTKIRCVRSV